MLDKKLLLSFLLIATGIYDKANAAEFTKILNDQEIEKLSRSLTTVNPDLVSNFKVTTDNELGARKFLIGKMLKSKVGTDGEIYSFVDSLDNRNLELILSTLRKDNFSAARFSVAPTSGPEK
ncbi:MAG: hypothetical protein HQK49_09045 [Oligoflexia bacterium]|nr:hypothetical protein [Oligoflexia bacterium]